MSVDVSPNGRSIVFDLLGDLYTVPITGGHATRIMGGMAMDVQPRYSPDGRSILFVSDRSGQDNLWIADADGRNPRPILRTELNNSDETSVAQYTQPVWTPDGRAILDGTSVRYVVATGATGPMPGLFGYSPAVGGDGRFIYLESNGIGVYDTVTHQIRQIVGSSDPLFRPVVSHDNHWLVYGTRRNARTLLRVRDLRTGADTLLMDDVQPLRDWSAGSIGKFPNFAFTPDNRAVIVATGGKFWRIAVPSGRRTAIPFRADVEQALGPLSQFHYPVTDRFTVRQIREPRLSPDGTKLAFIALDKLYLMDFPTGTPKRATHAVGVVENYPAWSPDGKYIAFATSSDSAPGEIDRLPVAAVLGASGSLPTPERLTREGDLYSRLTYAPDGRRLVYGRSPWRVTQQINYDYSPDTPIDFYWMSADGGPSHLITHATWVSAGPRETGAPPQFMTTDTSRLLIPQCSTVVSMRWDGSDQRTVFRWPSEQPEGIPSQGLLSPDGSHALLVYRNNAYLVTAPVGGFHGERLNPDTAPPNVSFRKLSHAGAEFIGWSFDGRQCYFALGHSVFLYDMTLMVPPQTLEDTNQKGRRHDIDVVAARAVARGTIVFRNAQLITMRGHTVITHGDLVVRDGRIAALGPTGTVRIPRDANVIDATGTSILPGYVDLHTHMLARFLTHNTQVPQYQAHLAYGVTTTRNPSTKTSDVLTYADRVDVGDLLGPRIGGTGPAVSATDRTMDPLQRFEDVDAMMRRYGEFYHTQTFKEYTAGNRRTRQWIVMAARSHNISPTTEGAGDFKMSLTEMLDGYAAHEHTFEIAPLYRDVALLHAASGLSYDLTLLVCCLGPPDAGLNRFIASGSARRDPKLRRFSAAATLEKVAATPHYVEADDRSAEASQSAHRLMDAGGRVGIGAHGELPGLGTHWELWLLSSGGWSNLDVLRAGTISGASALGLEGDIGSLDVGKLADLQVLDRDPLRDIHNTTAIRYVMKDGHLYDANTLDELWPRKRRLAPQWWQR